MSIVRKTIGNGVYQYDVGWDPKTKKQIWKYIGKVDFSVPKSDSSLSVGKAFTNAEKDDIKKMLEWILARRTGAGGQAGSGHRKAAALLLDRLRL